MMINIELMNESIEWFRRIAVGRKTMSKKRRIRLSNGFVAISLVLVCAISTFQSHSVFAQEIVPEGLMAYRIQDTPKPMNPGSYDVRLRIDYGKKEVLSINGNFFDFALSPDGTKLAFIAAIPNYWPWNQGDKNAEIFAIDLKDLSLSQLTSNDLSETYLSWSVDSSAILFSAQRSRNELGQLFELNLKSKTENQLTKNLGPYSSPYWSPDRKFIAYSDYLAGGIFKFDIETGTTLKISEVGDDPSWSPDGKMIAYGYDGCVSIGPGVSRCDPAVRGVYLFDVSNKSNRRLTGVCDRTVVWSPSGVQLACIGESRSNVREIYVVDSNSGQSIRYDDNQFNKYSLSWSKEGNILALSSAKGVVFDYGTELYYSVSTNAVKLSSEFLAESKATSESAAKAEQTTRSELTSKLFSKQEDEYIKLAASYYENAISANVRLIDLKRPLDSTRGFAEFSKSGSSSKSESNWTRTLVNLQEAISNFESAKKNFLQAQENLIQLNELRKKAEADQKAKKEAEAAATSKSKIITITCVKGKLSKKIKGIKPQCPKGYKKR
jgi:Tol biopolymer transport system component